MGRLRAWHPAITGQRSKLRLRRGPSSIIPRIPAQSAARTSFKCAEISTFPERHPGMSMRPELSTCGLLTPKRAKRCISTQFRVHNGSPRRSTDGNAWRRENSVRNPVLMKIPRDAVRSGWQAKLSSGRRCSRHARLMQGIDRIPLWSVLLPGSSGKIISRGRKPDPAREKENSCPAEFNGARESRLRNPARLSGAACGHLLSLNPQFEPISAVALSRGSRRRPDARAPRDLLEKFFRSTI